ncbi:MAG TPA: Stp1/IreP family PP2C-type Ser/Thr phosphatase [Phototrophicaceae bacterium]|nr:Stp1/IreP family PP2C-type Ser/Thr phosphatase [Phototrophicaceae bacterium]
MGGSNHGVRLRSSARTSIGQVRENNEDNVRLWAADEYVVAVVADGMGGAVAGEEASRIAVETLQQGKFLQTPDESPLHLNDDDAVKWLCDTIRNANSNIVHRAASNPELRGMGTTMTLAFVRSDSAIIAHVGDSRAYLVDGRTRRITQITADHSFVEAMVAAGHLTHEQAEEHPMRNVLYRALGQNEEVDVDVYEAHLRPGDRIVLCSDGLTRHVKPHEISSMVIQYDDPDEATQAMIDLANERGGEDNVSVIIVSLGDSELEEDTHELKHYLDLDDTLIVKDPRRDTVEISLTDDDIAIKTNAAPDSEGHDTLAPDQ